MRGRGEAEKGKGRKLRESGREEVGKGKGRKGGEGK